MSFPILLLISSDDNSLRFFLFDDGPKFLIFRNYFGRWSYLPYLAILLVINFSRQDFLQFPSFELVALYRVILNECDFFSWVGNIIVGYSAF
jgi:hypothetical protein